MSEAEPHPEPPEPERERAARRSRAPLPGRAEKKSPPKALLAAVAGGCLAAILGLFWPTFTPPGGPLGPLPSSPPAAAMSRGLDGLHPPSGSDRLVPPAAPRRVEAPAPARPDPGPALEGVNLEGARAAAPVRSGPRFERMDPLAPIAGETVRTPGGLLVSSVENKNFIEATPMSAAEAVGAELVKKPARPKCAGPARQIPPCAWKVEQRGGYCINEQGVVTTQQGVTGVEIPATMNGRVVPYAHSASDPGCDPVTPQAPEIHPR